MTQRLFTVFLGLVLGLALPANAAPPHVAFSQDRLFVDGKPAPYLFGAEVQYFRARGGPDRNIPRAQVLDLWSRLLDRVQQARMNTVIFYIPWDFHEPVEGVFDFDGTLDQDGDGNADYPSRDLKTFFKMVQARGIRYVMVRPGPYINAEWGPTGFGAVPKWFLEKYPEALAVSRTTGKPQVAAFGHPTFRGKTARWFSELYHQVLKEHTGPGKLITFLQIDNETNYFWDSVYERDFNPVTLERYRTFVSRKYDGDLNRISAAYGTDLKDLTELQPPAGANDRTYGRRNWHYDWFLFHDHEIEDYYTYLRGTWERLGVKEPDVVFTSCDSFNAPENGLLPRLDMRQGNRLTHTTMNIYPKTFGTQEESTLNHPMKAAHDAATVAASHRQFYGTAENWVMSTETVGGWFPPTEVSLATRQHTYGSLIGTGVKATIIYYFHEGWNWTGEEKGDTELHFDAPLDKDMNPRPAYALLESLGKALEGKLGTLALRSRPARASVLLAKDAGAQYPVEPGFNAVDIASTQSGALYGLLREAGYAVDIGYVDAMGRTELSRYSVVVWNPPGYVSDAARERLSWFLKWGQVLSIGDARLSRGGDPNLVELPRNPADGWNDDRYLQLKSVPSSLQEIKRLMDEAGVAPHVLVEAEDGQPYLHVWYRQSRGSLLVSVENFQDSPRTARIRLPEVQEKASYHWRHLWGPGALHGSRRISAEAQKQDGIALPVSPDGIDLWEVEIR